MQVPSRAVPARRVMAGIARCAHFRTWVATSLPVGGPAPTIGFMMEPTSDYLHIHNRPDLHDATLLLAFSGWMDGGHVSTGTVQRLVDLLEAEPFAEIDSDPFYIYNVPGPMEVTALFRPHIEIEGGQLQSIEMPSNAFYAHPSGNLVLFLGNEPHLRWPTFRDNLFRLAHEIGITKLLFVGAFGGTVPHTREPRMHVACSHADLLPEMTQYGVATTGYSGPGSFTSYLLSEAESADLKMTSLVAEIPSYLQGMNPSSILAVTRRLATILGLSPNLDELRTTSTEWELQVSSAVEDDEELAETVRRLEEAYDDHLLQQDEHQGEEE